MGDPQGEKQEGHLATWCRSRAQICEDLDRSRKATDSWFLYPPGHGKGAEHGLDQGHHTQQALDRSHEGSEGAEEETGAFAIAVMRGGLPSALLLEARTEAGAGQEQKQAAMGGRMETDPNLTWRSQRAGPAWGGERCC